MSHEFDYLHSFKGKRVLITGHTGFKGSWLSLLLSRLGAVVSGYALDPPTSPNLFELARVGELINSHIGDIREYEKLSAVLKEVSPEIVIHMAAQALVIESYKNPRETYEVNVMGTVNLFEAIRHTPGVKVVLNVTTDKCYENREWVWGYRENEPMGGFDPYSNSKGCSELVTSAYRSSYFHPDHYSKHGAAMASARAGNVIGGGDWANNRLIPDVMRSISAGESVTIRNPKAIRPWQHVLEPLNGYLMLCERLLNRGVEFSEGWNFGPSDNGSQSVEWIVDFLCKKWGEDASWNLDTTNQPHEANYLKLDCSKAKQHLQWNPFWDIETSLNSIVHWYKSYLSGADVREVCYQQMDAYYSADKSINKGGNH